MINNRKLAREWLARSTKTEFNNVIEESNITDKQREIVLLKFLRGHSNIQISLELHCSVETIRDEMARAYDKVYKVIKGGII